MKFEPLDNLTLLSYLIKMFGYSEKVKYIKGEYVIGINHKLKSKKDCVVDKTFSEVKIKKFFFDDVNYAITQAKLKVKNFSKQPTTIKLFLIILCFDNKSYLIDNITSSIINFNYGLSYCKFLNSNINEINQKDRYILANLLIFKNQLKG